MRTSLVLLALAVAAAAQDSAEDRLKDKLGKDFVKNAAWLTDFAEAKKRSSVLGKPIFAYFTRSFAP